MQTLSCLFIFSLLLLIPAQPLRGAERPAAEHVVLVSIDGFNPQWYQDESWPAPFLQQAARNGAYAQRARPVFPSVTRAGHTTIVTGWLPARHGVFSNRFPYRLTEGESIWHAVKAAGGSTAAVVWPGAGQAPIDHELKGLAYPDFSDATTTPDLADGIPSVTKGAGHSRTYERYFTGNFRDAQMMAHGAAFIEEHRPTLTTLRFNHPDSIQHQVGREGAAVRGTVASVDLGLAELAAAVQRAGIAERTVFIVTGDHGMEDIHTLLRPNVWLAEAGIGGSEGARFEPSGGAAFLVDATHEEAEAVMEILESLPAEVRDSFEVLSRDRLDDLGAYPDALLALAADAGFAFLPHWEGPAAVATQEGRHGHLAGPRAPGVYTGFVAWGAGIQQGAVLEEMGIEDVTPTIAELLGIEIGQRDGRSLLPQIGRSKYE
jgi:predicted AlkP superfamily pyrophosphatase or phosphodiesterase